MATRTAVAVAVAGKSRHTPHTRPRGGARRAERKKMECPNQSRRRKETPPPPSRCHRPAPAYTQKMARASPPLRRHRRPVLFRIGWWHVLPGVVVAVRNRLGRRNRHERRALGGFPHPPLHLHKGRRVGSGIGGRAGGARGGWRQRRQGSLRGGRALPQVEVRGGGGKGCRSWLLSL